jgi:hypothetical protein
MFPHEPVDCLNGAPEFVSLNSILTLGLPAQDTRIAAIVSRTFIQQDQLKILAGLPEDALNAPVQVTRVIVVQNDDANS